MTDVDYISQMGGLLGLFIGFSFISGIELIYWATVRLSKNMYMKSHQKKKVSSLNVKSALSKSGGWSKDN